MDGLKHIYETIVVLHPEMTEEEAEEGVQNVVRFLEGRGGEIIRVDRAGKRRLAYPVAKQRYGYYTLLHYRVPPTALAELERIFSPQRACHPLSHCTVRERRATHGFHATCGG